MKLFNIFKYVHQLTGFTAYVELDKAVSEGVKSMNHVFANTFNKFSYEIQKQMNHYFFKPETKLTAVNREGTITPIGEFLTTGGMLRPDDKLLFQGVTFGVPAKLLTGDPIACAVFARKLVREAQKRERYDLRELKVKRLRAAVDKVERATKELKKVEQEHSQLASEYDTLVAADRKRSDSLKKLQAKKDARREEALKQEQLTSV